MKIAIKPYLQKLGIKQLKKEQKQIITAVLNRKDILGVLPTGFGKSLCYILPHLILQKTVIVVSPLISLMHDQQRRYSDICSIVTIWSQNVLLNGHAMTQEESAEIFNGHKPCVVYMTPENFMSRKKWVQGMTKSNLALIAIDECHCVTSWDTFRDGYARLSEIKDWFCEREPPVVMAVTGTATRETMTKVGKVLNLKDPLTVRIAPTRDNLALSVRYVDTFQECIKLMNTYIQGQTIVYCKTQKDTERVARALLLFRSEYYHAGLSTERRNKIQSDFTGGTLQVMCATIAFGMGIDISNIQTIIHYGLPKDMESYCQEVGRAARCPGMEGACYILWCKRDYVINNLFLNKIENTTAKQEQKSKMRVMESYVNDTRTCRMDFIKRYFTPEDNERLSCGKCDTCTSVSDMCFKCV